jgi:hypothetical protein
MGLSRFNYNGKFRRKIRPWGSLSLLTEMSTGNIKKIIFLDSKVRPMLGADILTAMYEPIV